MFARSLAIWGRFFVHCWNGFITMMWLVLWAHMKPRPHIRFTLRSLLWMVNNSRAWHLNITSIFYFDPRRLHSSTSFLRFSHTSCWSLRCVFLTKVVFLRLLGPKPKAVRRCKLGVDMPFIRLKGNTACVDCWRGIRVSKKSAAKYQLEKCLRFNLIL